MVNQLVEKKDMVIYKSKVSAQDKLALKFVTPLDKQNRLFSGKLNDFWKSSKETGNSRVSEELISFLKRQGRGKKANSPKPVS